LWPPHSSTNTIVPRLDDESVAGFQNMLRVHLERLQPTDALEASLVEDLGADPSRLPLRSLHHPQPVQNLLVLRTFVPAPAGPEPEPLGSAVPPGGTKRT